jgi:HSP20 family protein
MATQTYLPSIFNGAFGTRNPFADFRGFNDELNRLFNTRRATTSHYPAFNIYSNDEETVVVAPLPGFKAEDIDISVERNRLTLSGSREKELAEGEQYHRRERFSGEFKRSLTLPFAVDEKQVEAKFSDGVLEIKLPRAAEDKPKKIAIKSA